MRTRLGRLFVMFAPALPLLSCSLMGLDDFGGSPCTSRDDCVKAESRLRPGSAACGYAMCDAGSCKWHQNVETCNGLDDDCDGLIDNGLVFPEQTSGAAQAVPIAIASNSSQTFVAIPGDEGASWGFTLNADVPPTQLSYDSTSESGKCPISDMHAGFCNFEEVALAADETHLVVASINKLGCAAGQVRVGLGTIKSTPFAVWLGKPKDVLSSDQSNIYTGVNVDELGCTRGAKSASLGGVVPKGAARPAVASLGTEANGGGALLLWLATPENKVDTAVGPVPIEALGLSVSMDKPEWINGPDGGKPIELGVSTSNSAPAVLALKPPAGPGKGSYLVAFPGESDAGKGIQLVSVSVDAARATLNHQTLLSLDVGAAEQVSLALGNSARAEVGLIWSSGSGADSQLRFTVVSTTGEWLHAGEIMTIPSSTPRAPQLLYRPAGFAMSEPTGGWFVAWVEGVSNDTQRFRVARVREKNFDVWAPSALQADGIPVLFPSKDGDVGYAVIASSKAADRQLETKPLWCQ